MSADCFQEYHVNSARASWHEYGGGMYFVTICTANKVHYFGEIDDADGEPQIRLSPIGRCVADNLANVSDHYPSVEIPLFVVMPNHVHALIIINGEQIPGRVETRQVWRAISDALSDNADGCSNIKTEHAPSLQERMEMVSKRKGYLSVVVGGIKSAVTRFARTNGISFDWQSRFYDRIVRNQNEMNRIATYIEENIAKWQYDELNNY